MASAIPKTFDDRVRATFGRPESSIEEIATRASTVFPELRAIVWEGDASTFAFTYVSEGAATMLGYPTSRWVREASFWADHVILPTDRGDAVAYCALATAKAADHVFEYRARTAGGEVMWLRDFVVVILGPRRIPTRLRGIMFDISAEKVAASDDAVLHLPTIDQLSALPPAPTTE